MRSEMGLATALEAILAKRTTRTLGFELGYAGYVRTNGENSSILLTD